MKTLTPLLILTLSVTLMAAGYEPMMIAELWRHGARSPAVDTFKDDFTKIEGPGNLMGNGMRMHYLLGKKIRNLYKDSLFKNPIWSDYKVLSTTYQRTMLSAESHMMGLYPLGTGKDITANTNKYLHYPPFKGMEDSDDLNENTALPSGYRAIPILTVEKSDKIFIKGIKQLCPVAYAKNKALWKKRIGERQPDIDAFGKLLTDAEYKVGDYFPGKTKWDIQTAGYFADVNKCYYHYKGQPMKNTDSFYNKMKYVFGIFYINSKYYDPNIRRLYTSGLMQSIIDEFEKKITGKSKLKFFGLSGHEANVVPIMMNYKMTTEDCLVKELKGETVTGTCTPSPEFAANFIWELSKKDGEYYIKVLYNGEPVQTCKAPNTDGYCIYSDFKSYVTTNFLLSAADYKTTCVGDSIPTPPKDDDGFMKWVYIFSVQLGILALAVTAYLCLRSKPMTNEDLDASMARDSLYDGI